MRTPRLKQKHKQVAIQIFTAMRAGSCLRKVKFTEIEADNKALVFKQRKYQCRYCNCWHLTKIKE